MTLIDCPACGRINGVNRASCIECGARLRRVSPRRRKFARKKPNTLLVVFATIIACLLTTLFFSESMRKEARVASYKLFSVMEESELFELINKEGLSLKGGPPEEVVPRLEAIPHPPKIDELESVSGVELQRREGGERVVERYRYEPGVKLVNGGIMESEDGQKKSEGYMLDDGSKVGFWTFWYAGGWKWKEGTYVNGEKHGVWEVWSPPPSYDDPQGQKSSEETYKNGRLINWVRYKNGLPVKE